jgi:hypothetical protein
MIDVQLVEIAPKAYSSALGSETLTSIGCRNDVIDRRASFRRALARTRMNIGLHQVTHPSSRRR